MKCTQCFGGYGLNSTIGTCTQCIEGSASWSDGTLPCHHCSIGCSSCSPVDGLCSQCVVGYGLIKQAGKTICTLCVDGTHSNGTTSCLQDVELTLTTNNVNVTALIEALASVLSISPDLIVVVTTDIPNVLVITLPSTISLSTLSSMITTDTKHPVLNQIISIRALTNTSMSSEILLIPSFSLLFFLSIVLTIHILI